MPPQKLCASQHAVAGRAGKIIGPGTEGEQHGPGVSISHFISRTLLLKYSNFQKIYKKLGQFYKKTQFWQEVPNQEKQCSIRMFVGLQYPFTLPRIHFDPIFRQLAKITYNPLVYIYTSGLRQFLKKSTDILEKYGIFRVFWPILGLFLILSHFRAVYGHFWRVFGIFLQTGKSDWALVFSIGLVPLSRLFW